MTDSSRRKWILVPFPYVDSAAHIGPFDTREEAERSIEEDNLAYVAIPFDPDRYADEEPTS